MVSFHPAMATCPGLSGNNRQACPIVSTCVRPQVVDNVQGSAEIAGRRVRLCQHVCDHRWLTMRQKPPVFQLLELSIRRKVYRIHKVLDTKINLCQVPLSIIPASPSLRRAAAGEVCSSKQSAKLMGTLPGQLVRYYNVPADN